MPNKSEYRPTVSVVIPAKNEADNIGRCLESISALDYRQDLVDVTVVDNGSSDDTRGEAEKRGVRVLRDDSATIAQLRNLGASATNGEVLAFLDADMEVQGQWLATAVEVLAHPGTGAVGGTLLLPGNATWVERVKALNRASRPENGKVEWLGSGNFLVTRKVLSEVGGWNGDLKTCEDLELCGRLKKTHDLVFHKDVAAVHHGGDRTLRALFRKEIWRGSSSWANAARGNLSLRDLPSLLFPVLHGLLLVLGLVLFLFHPKMVLLSLGLAFLFPFLRSAWVVWHCGRPRYFLHLLFIWQIYYTARSISFMFK